MLPRPVFARTKATSSRFSQAWVWTRIPEARGLRGDRFEQRRASTTPRSAAPARCGCGRSPGRASGGAGRGWRRCRRATARAAAPARRRRRPSGTCRPWRGCRSAASASSTASVSCTVSIVSTVVVPVRSSSWTASRAEAAQRRRRVRRFERPDALLQPLEQRQIVGQARGTASGTDGRGSGRSRGGGSRRRRRSRDRRGGVPGGVGADPGDHAVRDPHVPGDDRAVVIHREDGGVADPEGGQMRTSTRYFALRPQEVLLDELLLLALLQELAQAIASPRRAARCARRARSVSLMMWKPNCGLDQVADLARS